MPNCRADGGGLAELHAIMAGERPAPPIWAVLGFRMIDADSGSVTLEGLPASQYGNGLGGAHGGYIAALLDSAMACAVQSLLPADSRYTSAEIKISYIRPVLLKEAPVRATGKVINVGRRLAFAQGELRDADGVIVAHGTTTIAIL